MFTSKNVEALLKSVVLDTQGDRRIAKCQLRIHPVNYELVCQISPRIADRLYRQNGKGEWWPAEEMPGVSFDTRRIPRQRLEFSGLPSQPSTAGTIDDVQIYNLQAIRIAGSGEGKGSKSIDFSLVFGMRFPIPAGDRRAVSRFVIDLLHQTVFLTMVPTQHRLAFDDPDKDIIVRKPAQEAASLGRFINNRNQDRPLSVGERRPTI